MVDDAYSDLCRLAMLPRKKISRMASISRELVEEGAYWKGLSDQQKMVLRQNKKNYIVIDALLKASKPNSLAERIDVFLDCTSKKLVRGQMAPLLRKHSDSIFMGKGPALEALFLLGCAQKGTEASSFSGARKMLRNISKKDSSPVFVLPSDAWAFAMLYDPVVFVGLYGLYSNTIFLDSGVEEDERLEHIALHEMIHSIQGSGSYEKEKYDGIRSILLEGVTEEMTVELTGREYGVYLPERGAVRQIIKRSDSLLLEELALLDPDKLFERIGKEFFSGRRWQYKTANLVRSLYGSQTRKLGEKPATLFL